MWLDNLRSCYLDQYGNKLVGLNLILLHNYEDGAWYDNITGGPCMNWKREYGTLVNIAPQGVESLYDYFKKGRKTDISIPESIKVRNNTWLTKHRILRNITDDYNTYTSNSKYYLYPQLDLIDYYYIQQGLNGGIWKELPSGLHGITVNNRNPFASEEAWVQVIVDKEFNDITENRYKDLLPCYGILTWDNSV